MTILLQVLIGIGLAATCGFRLFLPFLVMGIAGLGGYLDLSPSFGWIASYPAVIIFGVAAVIEIAAYFIPFVDNLLDKISIPVSIAAGVIVTASVITEISPILQWTLAIIAGGGAAAVTGLISNGAHDATTLVSGGGANPALSAVESAAAAGTAILAIVVPMLAFILFVILVIVAYRVLRRLIKKKPPVAPSANH
jgi:hypothetical protein